MKKVISLLLAVVLVLGLSVSAFADGPTVTNGSQSVDAEYMPGTVSDTGTVYFVQLEWTSIAKLTYTQGNTTYRWDGTQYVVDNTAAGTWSGGSFEAKITNKSNADVTATAVYADNTSDSLTTKMTWTTVSVTCESAAKNITNYTGTGEPTTGTLSGTVSVTSGTISADTVGVGTITINLS